MARDPSALLDEALRLPSEARARLVAELLRSLDDDDEEPLDQAEYDAAWGVVVERRLREIESGAVKPIPWSEARGRIASEE
jgi:putative addiction module component (TIGR02574 family)